MWSKQSNVEFGYKFCIFSMTEENHGNIDGAGRSQDLPSVNWLLASIPARKYTNPNVSP
jgi:hypothetical protein